MKTESHNRRAILQAAFKAIAGALCLTTGLLLWRNLALHFAEMEETLPGLRVGGLLQGKTFLLGLTVLALLLAAWIWITLPWQRLIAGIGHPWRNGIAVTLFAVSLIPVFWLRLGEAAELIILLLGITFLLNGAGLIGLSSFLAWLANLLRPAAKPPRAVPQLWRRLHPWLPAILLFLCAWYFSRHCFGEIPHVEDAIAQLLQARIFASGALTAAPFQLQEFFFFGFMADGARWLSQYPPGHPLVLALGVLAGVPHLINPLLGLLAVVLFFSLLRGLEGEQAARWGVWAMALSPFVIFMSSEFMNSSTALAASLLGWLALKKGETGRQGWLMLAGLAFGYTFLTRPLDGAIFGALGGLFLLGSFGWKMRASWAQAAPYALAFLIMSSLYFLYNLLTAGHPFVTGYSLTWGGSGFGLGAVNWGAPHTLGYGLMNTSMSLAGLNVYLWEIPLPALLGVFIWAILGGKLNRWDKIFLAGMMLVPLGYLFYYFHDYCFGPRYYYTIVPQLAYFSVKGVIELYRRLVSRLGLSALTVKRGLIAAAVLILLAQTLIALPFRATVYSSAYWGTDDGPWKEAQRLGLQQAIVFIENRPWEILQTRLHHLGFIMGDAHRLLFVITPEGLDRVLEEMGYAGEAQWGARVDLRELERRIYAWNEAYLQTGNAPVDPWAEQGQYTYFSNGAVHLDPRDREPEVILARDLGKRNHALAERFPGRKTYRYAWDEEVKRFRILPLEIVR